MWVTTTSCLRVGPEKRPVTLAQAEESCLVTVQQARSTEGKSIVVAAIGSTIGDKVAFICLRGDGSNSNRVISLNLADLNILPVDKQHAVTDISNLTKWDTSVPHPSIGGAYPAPAAFVGLFGAAVYVVSPSSTLLVFDTETGALQNSHQISDSRVISCNLGSLLGDGTVILFCLTERGNIHRVKCAPK